MLPLLKSGSVSVLWSFYLLFFIYKVNRRVQLPSMPQVHSVWNGDSEMNGTWTRMGSSQARTGKDRRATSSVSMLSCPERLRCKLWPRLTQCLACSLLNLSTWQCLDTMRVFKKYLLSEWMFINCVLPFFGFRSAIVPWSGFCTEQQWFACIFM